MAEGYEAPYLRPNPRLASLGAGSAQEETSYSLWTEALHPFHRIDALVSLVQDLCVHVGCQDGNRWSQRGGSLCQSHGDGIGLFTTGTATTPYLKVAAGLLSYEMLRQQGKVVWFAKKRR